MWITWLCSFKVIRNNRTRSIRLSKTASVSSLRRSKHSLQLSSTSQSTVYAILSINFQASSRRKLISCGKKLPAKPTTSTSSSTLYIPYTSPSISKVSRHTSTITSAQTQASSASKCTPRPNRSMKTRLYPDHSRKTSKTHPES